ncbi:MAG: CRISPR-associated endonuclease Cas3'', partial [Roseiflexus sp.]|nr:CRISPR-associated endonuclease Cas3'' [Roseiflexus sp.]
LVFPSSVLTYCSNMGLRSGPGGQSFSPLSSQSSPSPPSYSQQNRESWIDHSVCVAQETCKVLQQERFAVSSLARLLNVSDDTVREAAFVAALLHDLGKLNKEWQNRAGISDQASADDLLAHTPARTYSNFPPHATVGAYALWETLVNNTKLPRILAKAVCFAIAHHHSVRAKEVPKYELHGAWRNAVEEALHIFRLNNILNLGAVIQRQGSSTNLRERFPPMEYERLYTAYVLLSRWLRLADRIATGGPAAIEDYEDWFGCL